MRDWPNRPLKELTRAQKPLVERWLKDAKAGAKFGPGMVAVCESLLLEWHRTEQGGSDEL